MHLCFWALFLIVGMTSASEISVEGKFGVGTDFMGDLGEDVGLFYGNHRLKKSVVFEFPIMFNRVFGIQSGVQFFALSERFDGPVYEYNWNTMATADTVGTKGAKAKTSSYFIAVPFYFRFEIPVAKVTPYIGVGGEFAFSRWERSWFWHDGIRESNDYSLNLMSDSLVSPVKKSLGVRPSILSQIAGVKIPLGSGYLIFEERFNPWLDLGLNVGYGMHF